MYSYIAYNLCIHSEFPLPELIPAEDVPDVVVRRGNLDSVEQKLIAAQGDRVFGRLPGIAAFLIENGRQITVEPLAEDESMLSPSILGAAMSVILRQRGMLVLHASSVAINGRVIAFMGGSGWGKSTLANAFHAKGYPVLTDDVLAIDMQSTSPVVIPAFPQFKLCHDAAVALGHDTDTLKPLFPSALKLSYKLTQGFQQTPLPIHGIYVLDKGDRHQITRLKPQDAFAELIRHTRSPNLLSPSAFAAPHLRQCAELIQRVVFSRFTRQPSLVDLPVLVKLVEEDLSGSFESNQRGTVTPAATANLCQ